MSDEFDILFIPESFIGGLRVRSQWPAQALSDRGWSTRVLRGTLPLSWRPRVVIVHRPLYEDKFVVIRYFRGLGIPVILSEDDDLMTNPTYGYLREHREGSNLRAYEAFLDQHVEAARHVDAMIVTTPRLKEVYSRFRDPDTIHVVENYLPEWVSRLRKGKRLSERPVVGWMGSWQTHQWDLRWIAPAMGDLLGDIAEFGWIGPCDLNVPSLLGLAERSYHCLGKIMEPENLYRAMTRFDLAIVPLDLDRRFNAAKSWLKALEFASCGVPVVAAASAENVRLAEEHEQMIGLASSPQEMAEQVQTLLGIAGLDRDLFRQLGQVTQRHARRITVEVMAGEWENAITSVLGEREKVRT